MTTSRILWSRNLNCSSRFHAAMTKRPHVTLMSRRRHAGQGQRFRPPPPAIAIDSNTITSGLPKSCQAIRSVPSAPQADRSRPTEPYDIWILLEFSLARIHMLQDTNRTAHSNSGAGGAQKQRRSLRSSTSASVVRVNSVVIHRVHFALGVCSRWCSI